MDIGQAVAALEAGHCVRRAGWNGKGMHVYMEYAHTFKLPNVKEAGVFRGTSRQYAAHLVLFTAQGVHQPGWNASTPDLLAKDWEKCDPDTGETLA